jgi:hypothetical protein
MQRAAGSRPYFLDKKAPLAGRLSMLQGLVTAGYPSRTRLPCLLGWGYFFLSRLAKGL